MFFKKEGSDSIISYVKWQETKKEKTYWLIDRIQNSHWFWHNEEANIFKKKKNHKKQS